MPGGMLEGGMPGSSQGGTGYTEFQQKRAFKNFLNYYIKMRSKRSPIVSEQMF